MLQLLAVVLMKVDAGTMLLRCRNDSAAMQLVVTMRKNVGKNGGAEYILYFVLGSNLHEKFRQYPLRDHQKNLPTAANPSHA